MKPWQRIAKLIGILIAAGVALFVYAMYRHLTQTIPDCYAQWATAELVIGFHADKNELPKGWSDLAPYYPASCRHHGNLSFDDLKAKITIDFPGLNKLAKRYLIDSEIPEVIQTVSGIQAHWSGTEPNRLVNHELLSTSEKPKSE